MLDAAPQEAYKEAVLGWIDEALSGLRLNNIPKALWASILWSHLGVFKGAPAREVNELYSLAESLPEAPLAPHVDSRAALARSSQDQQSHRAQPHRAQPNHPTKRSRADPQLVDSEVEEIVRQHKFTAQRQAQTTENMLSILHQLRCSQPGHNFNRVFKERKDRVCALVEDENLRRTLLVAGLYGDAREMLDILIPTWKNIPAVVLAKKLTGYGRLWNKHRIHPSGTNKKLSRASLPDLNAREHVTNHPPINFDKFKGKEHYRARTLLRQLFEFGEIDHWGSFFQALVSKVHIYVAPQHRMEWLRWSFAGNALAYVEKEIPEFWNHEMHLEDLIWRLHRLKLPDKKR